ncbi:hypothetical protein AB0E01_07720 [Nocardia vinacea]
MTNNVGYVTGCPVVPGDVRAWLADARGGAWETVWICAEIGEIGA